jgi:hypothetical protein
MDMTPIYSVLETVRADIRTEHELIEMSLATDQLQYRNSFVISILSEYVTNQFINTLESLPYVSFAFAQVNPDHSAYSIIRVNQSAFAEAQHTISKFNMIAKLKNDSSTTFTIGNFK